MWKVGDKLRHRFNPEAGPGRVTAVEGRHLVVHFPASDTTVRLAASNDALAFFEMRPGSPARLDPGGEIVRIEAREGERYRLADGRLVEDSDLWPLDRGDTPIERLARGEIDSLDAFANRLDALYLRTLREAAGLGSFLGGRIKIFPHQLYVAERATRTDPVRWLLADEVGLGKTVEACLILNHLARTGRAERILIVAPATLTVQWLGELYRKFHRVFVLLDEKRRQDVARELGADFNPFEAHSRTIIALEELVAEARLSRLAEAAGHDLVIVDEAHRLERPPGHPGSPAYRAALPLVRSSRHALLLTATPLESDAHGFFRLLQLLRPDQFPEEDGFEKRLALRDPLPPCTSATRRVDIGGLPPRVPIPIEGEASASRPLDSAALTERSDATDSLDATSRTDPDGSEPPPTSAAARTRLEANTPSGQAGIAARGAQEEASSARPRREEAWARSISREDWTRGWDALLALEERVRRMPAGTPVERRRRIDRYRRALASAAALASLLAAEETLARAEAAEAAALDPRAAWLAAQAPGWRRAREKTLIFVAHLETLEWLKASLERATSQRVGLFHESLSPARADIEVAQFRLASGPALLIATECGGEGRNFQFCRRLVLFDLPWNAGVLEQRIGRLDRIDRTRPVEIVYFRPPRGLALEVARLYEDLGGLRETLGGLEGTFPEIERAVEAAAAGDVGADEIAPVFSRVLTEARGLRSRIREAAWHELHREPYAAAMGPGIVSRIPPDLEETTSEVVLAACENLGFHVVPQRGRETYAIEFGSAATIDHLPGVPGGSNFLGTFDREEAVEKETIDFFASGHPLVEGILQELEEGSRGRVALLQVRAGRGAASTVSRTAPSEAAGSAEVPSGTPPLERRSREGAGIRSHPGSDRRQPVDGRDRQRGIRAEGDPLASGPPSEGARPSGAGDVVATGVLALYIDDGRLVSIILDENGRERPEWSSLLLARPLRSQRVDPRDWVTQPGWSDHVRGLLARIPRKDPPVAVAAFRIIDDR